MQSPLRVVWQGSQLVHHSLALVNREICSRLLDDVSLSCRLREAHDFKAAGQPRLERLEARFEAPLDGPVDVWVRHFWPPDFRRPDARRFVLIQPWEFGSLPADWIGPMREIVDEVWVPTSFVARCYVESGVPAAKVRVVPNGVDAAHFSPEAAPYPLATRARFRFLFVGGTIARKGIALLLEAWRQAFSPDDDVCLVIKDMGGEGVYRGATARDRIAAAAADPGVAEILHLDAMLRDEDLPGLYTACDAFVHPYLGEGFGLPIAEAMACERSVIVTGAGASLDFAGPDEVRQIPAGRVELSEARVGTLRTVARPYLAAPDLGALVAHLRAAALAPPEDAVRARAARLRVLRELSWERATGLVLARLEALSGR